MGDDFQKKNKEFEAEKILLISYKVGPIICQFFSRDKALFYFLKQNVAHGEDQFDMYRTDHKAA